MCKVQFDTIPIWLTSVGYFTCFFFVVVATVLHCFVHAFSSCTEQGLIFTAVHGLLIVVASAAAEHKL